MKLRIYDEFIRRLIDYVESGIFPWGREAMRGQGNLVAAVVVTAAFILLLTLSKPDGRYSRGYGEEPIIARYHLSHFRATPMRSGGQKNEKWLY